MATPEDEIRDLKAEIALYTTRFNKAVDEGNEGREERYANLITATEKRLYILLLQQQQGE
jgi:hypothetical protein